MRLKRESPTPLYLQLKNTLVTEISSGRYRPHQRLPSERDLCERYRVSRMTVRQALGELMRDGLVYARVGLGTFVTEPKINYELRSLTGFSQDVTTRGGIPSSRVLEARIIPANFLLSKILNVAPESEIAKLSRLRMSDGIPLCIETAHLPHRRFPGLLEHNFAVESLYQVLEKEFDVRLVRADQTMEAGLGSQAELELLQMEHPGAVLRIERLTHIGQDSPVEYVVSVYRGDRYKFRTTLSI